MTSGLPWFRLYTEIIDDEIVTLLAFEDRWHFVVFMALKRRGVTDKKFPSEEFRERALAKKLGLDIEAFKDVRSRLVDAGLIDKKCHPIAWDKRQMASDTDPTNAERQARYRERKKQKAAMKNGRNVNSNATVTGIDKEGVTETDNAGAASFLSSEEKTITNNADINTDIVASATVTEDF